MTPGLSSAAVKISYVNAPTANDATLTSTSDIRPDRHFDDALGPDRLTASEILADDELAVNPIAGLSEWVSLEPTTPARTQGAVGEIVVPGSKYRLRLGSFRFVAGPEWNVYTPIIASMLYPNTPNNVPLTWTFTPPGVTTAVALDNPYPMFSEPLIVILPDQTVLATIPEPTSLALAVGAMFAGGLVWFVRRRKHHRGV
jgi:LPXTG-motif cell wall-anchored protein